MCLISLLVVALLSIAELLRLKTGQAVSAPAELFARFVPGVLVLGNCPGGAGARSQEGGVSGSVRVCVWGEETWGEDEGVATGITKGRGATRVDGGEKQGNGVRKGAGNATRENGWQSGNVVR